MFFELSDDDYLPMSDFDLRWRWTDEAYDLLDHGELARIRPLTVHASTRAAKLSYGFHESDGAPVPSQFSEVETLQGPHDGDAASWLTQRLPEDPTVVIVSWDKNRAVATDADLFCKHWKTFCYPMSDDVSVWPLDVRWIVAFWHEEQLWFGHRKNTDDLA